MSTTQVETHESLATEHAHPGPLQYIKIAIFLAVVTLVEVVLFYVSLADWVLVTLLMILSVLKFAFVVQWFMHLRFDSRLFRRLFVAGLILAGIVYTIMLFTFGILIGK